MVSRIAIFAAAGLAFSAPALALDCTTTTTVVKSKAQSLAVTALGGPNTTLSGSANCDTMSTAEINTALDEKANASDVDAKNDEQDSAIKNNYAWDKQQQKQINQQGKAIAHNYMWDAAQQWQINKLGYENKIQWGAIGGLYHENQEQWQAINANTALLSQHSARLDEHEKGLAIAMAMPDAWLSDRERFAIAGNIGGFGDETALGFAAIGRINETWSINGKLGADTSFEEFGWTVGARAGW